MAKITIEQALLKLGQASKNYIDAVQTSLNNAKSDKGHEHKSSDITSMAGYTKKTATAISNTDSLNTAIGKLEALIDTKQPNGSYSIEGHTHDDRYYTETEINGKVSTLEKSITDGDSSTLSAAKNYTDTEIASLINGAPGVLDTLDELAAALGDDKDFAANVSNTLATKVDKVTGKGLSTNDYTTAEKNKLSGIAEGAQVNQNAFSNVKVSSTTIAADSVTDTLEIVAGSNITITPDASNDKITIAATDTTYGNATQSGGGLMSVDDKKKLDGIASGAEVNQNAFSKVVVGSTTVEADTKTDTLTLAAGDNVTITPDATNDKITITAKDTTYSTGTASTSGLTKLYTSTGTNTDGTMTQSAIKSALDGKANTHSHDSYVNQNAFSNVVVGSTTIAADNATDTLTLVAGSNITLTPDATNDKVTIAATDTVYTHPSHTAVNGVPTENPSPGFGGTFMVNQVTNNALGHVTGNTARTVTIPSTLSNGTGTAGLIKTSSTVTSASGYTACPVISGVPYYKDTDTKYTHPSYTAYANGLYKVTVDSSGHVSSATAVAKSDITGLGIPGQDTTYSAATQSAAGLMTADDKKKLDGIDTNANKYTHPTTSGNKHIPSGGSSGQILRWSADGTAVWGADTNTTYSADTGIKLNGTTFQHTNAVTAATAQGSATKTLTWGGTFTIPTVTYDAQGHITAKGTTTMTMPSNPNSDTHYTAKNIVGASNSAKANAAATNGNVFLNLIENDTVRSAHKIVGSGATTVTSDANGVITISSTDNNTVYTHPTHTAYTSGLYKITTNSYGHVTAATAVTKADITGLGIPGSDTKYTHPTHTAYDSGLYKVTVDGSGHVTAATAVTKADITGLGIPGSDTNTHYTTGITAGATGTTSNSATSNPFIKIKDDSTHRGQIQIKGGGATSVSSDANGVITITSTDNNTVYTHPTYTATTGVPTGNQTPGFGGTFSVNQISSDTTGHVSGNTSRTITIPSTLSNGNSTAGLIKTSSTVTSATGYTACPVINGVPYYKDTDSDTDTKPGTLTTTSTSALSTATNESLTGNISLHKVSKTGSYNDLNDKPTIPTIPGSLKNPNALTVKGNGTQSFTYDGSAAKTLNIKSGTNISVSSDTSGNITVSTSGLTKATSTEITTMLTAVFG